MSASRSAQLLETNLLLFLVRDNGTVCHHILSRAIRSVTVPSRTQNIPLPSTPDLKLISFTNPFLHSHSYSSRTDFTDLNLYSIKGALFVLVSGYVC